MDEYFHKKEGNDFNMKIYFAGSIMGGREKQSSYEKLITLLKTYGIVLTEHVGKKNVNIENEVKFSDQPETHVYLRDIHYINQSDLIIAECSIPSLGVGYEIGYALSLKKDVVVLYDQTAEKPLSWMLLGNDQIKIINYENLMEAEEKLASYIKERCKVS